MTAHQRKRSATVQLREKRGELNNRIFYMGALTTGKIRHHRESTVETLLRRIEEEIRVEEHRQMLYRYYQFMKVQNYAIDTIYVNLIKAFHFIKFIEAKGKTVDNVSMDDINTYLSQYKNVNSIIGCIRAIRGLAKANIMFKPAFHELAKQVKYPKKKIILPELPTPEMVERLIEHAKQPYSSILAILYECGLRLCECLSLKYGDVEEWRLGYKIYVRTSKSLPRAVFLVKYAHILREWLIKHRTKDPGDWLFYNSAGNPIMPSAFRMYLYRLCRRLNIPSRLVHPHNLRHLRATELYKSRKLTELELMKLFGWRSRMMIDVYSKITMDDVEKRILELYGASEEEGKEDVKITCPQCGLTVSGEVRYCPRCGRPLVEEAVVEEVSERMRAEERVKQLLRELLEIVKKNPEIIRDLLSM